MLACRRLLIAKTNQVTLQLITRNKTGPEFLRYFCHCRYDRVKVTGQKHHRTSERGRNRLDTYVVHLPFSSFFRAPLKWSVIDVYTLIHSFLKERSHTKAASALKKAVNGIVTIDDAAIHDGPTLQRILEEWKELKAKADAMYVQ